MKQRRQLLTNPLDGIRRFFSSYGDALCRGEKTGQFDVSIAETFGRSSFGTRTLATHIESTSACRT
jgi:hypothetical protein